MELIISILQITKYFYQVVIQLNWNEYIFMILK